MKKLFIIRARAGVRAGLGLGLAPASGSELPTAKRSTCVPIKLEISSFASDFVSLGLTLSCCLVTGPSLTMSTRADCSPLIFLSWSEVRFMLVGWLVVGVVVVDDGDRDV